MPLTKPPDTVQLAKAPKGWDTQRVLLYLQMDPYQTRVSPHPITLTHPRRQKTLVLKEYIEEYLTEARFAIETENGLVFVSRLTIPRRDGEESDAPDYIFKAAGVVPKDAVKRK